MRTLGISLSLECPQCAAAVWVDGIAREVTCPACQRRVNLPSALWGVVAGNDVPFTDTSGSAEVDGLSFKMRYALAAPLCGGCGRPLTALRCSCGVSAPAEPPARDIAPGLHHAAAYGIGMGSGARTWFLVFDETRLATAERAHRMLGIQLSAAALGVLSWVWSAYVLLEGGFAVSVPLGVAALGVVLVLPLIITFLRAK
jgi:hypothetical protein